MKFKFKNIRNTIKKEGIMMKSLNNDNELWNELNLEKLEKREEYSKSGCCDFCCFEICCDHCCIQL